MLPAQSLSMPREWREPLEELSPVFARRSTHRLFTVLACGLLRPRYLNIQRRNYLWTIRHSSARIAGNLIT
jgi:hypothetical protein